MPVWISGIKLMTDYILCNIFEIPSTITKIKYTCNIVEVKKQVTIFKSGVFFKQQVIITEKSFRGPHLF